MNCLSREDIQRFLDKEVEAPDLKRFETHIAQCDECRLNLTFAIKEISMVHQAYNQWKLIDEEPEIKPFVPRRNKPRNLKILVITLAVAASLLFVIVIENKFWIRHKPEFKPTEIEMTLYEMMKDSDPNAMWHSSEIIIIITDENGKVIQNETLNNTIE